MGVFHVARVANKTQRFQALPSDASNSTRDDCDMN
jgi:hypothetical protein